MTYFIGRKSKAIIIIGLIFFVGIYSLIKIDFSSKKTQSNTYGEGVYTFVPPISAFPVEMKLRDEFDLDGDKIDDTLEDEVLNVRGQSSTELKLIIETQAPVTEEILNSFVALGGKITAGPWSSSVYGFAGTLSVGQVRTFAKQYCSDLLLIQSDNIVKASMAFAAQQVGVRPYVWDDFGLTGDWNSSIAVVDTGIDPSHVDFSPGYGDQDFLNSKIVGWRDFTLGGSNATPYDDSGHGSHVSGIAAGDGFTTRDGSSRVVATKSGEMSFFAEALLLGEGTYERTLLPLFVNQSGWIEIQFNWTDISMMSTATVQNLSLWRGTTPLVSIDPTPMGTVHTLQWEVNPNELGTYYLNMTTVIADFVGFIQLPAVVVRAEVHFPMQDLPDGDPLWTGIANNTRLVGVKVLRSDGSGNVSEIINGIEWIIANRVQYHITVMSLSLGTQSSDNSIINAVENAVNSGIVVVVAAGNSGAGSNQVSNTSPANADSVITVGSVNRFNNISYFSSQGGETPSGMTIKPDVVAPGGGLAGDIFSADANSGDTSYMGDSFPDDAGMMSGTSMATPVVSGVVALLIEALGGSNSWNYTREEALRVKGLLCMTASEVYPLEREAYPQYSPVLNHGTKDIHEGYGIINPYAAITALIQNINVDDEVTSTLYTAGDTNFQNEKHCWARNMELTANATHSYVFNLSVPVTGDFDLYLYSNNTNYVGEPMILQKSCKNQLGGNEIVYYNCTQDESVYLVVKAVSGNGEFNVAVTRETVDDPTTPVFIRVGHDPIIVTPTTPVKILAMVQDDETGIGKVGVFYTADILSGWDVVEMQLESDDVYSATIGTFPTGLVYYYINASNQVSNFAWSPTGAPNEFYDFVVTNTSFGGDFSVLYVHDSDGESASTPTVRSCYENALQGIGVSYTYWNTVIDGTPSYDDLNDYSAVVWSLGPMADLNNSECMSLWEYLENGGKLFLSGMWIGFMIDNTTFRQDYLRISNLGFELNLGSMAVTELGWDGDPISDNLDLTVNGVGGTNTFMVVEHIANLSGSVPLFNSSTALFPGTGNISATRYSGSYQLVLLDFNFEAINSASDRQEIMQRSLEWFGYGQGLAYPPNVTDILYYQDFDPINNTIIINGSAWGDYGINHTRFYIDNFWCANDSTIDYSYEWDTTSWPDGQSNVTFVAYDNYWHYNSSGVSLMIDNLPPQDLTLGGLANYSYISGLYDVIPEFVEPSGVNRVEYSVNDSLNYTTYGPGYAWIWDTSTLEDGDWELNVTVFSVLNRSATVMVTVIIDNVLPSVTITAPLNYTSVQGTYLLEASASDNIAIDRVEFWVNGTQIDSVTYAPYETSWQTSDFGDGWVYIEAKVYDFASNVNTSNVIIDIDNQPPEYISIAPLTNGTFINETYSINVVCQDPSGFDRVEFSVNGSWNSTDISAPYSWDWDTTLFDDGWWELNVTCFSPLNNSNTTLATVFIHNLIPFVSITNPLNNSMVQDSITIQAIALDAAGIDRVEFSAGGSPIGTVYAIPYEILWDSTSVPDGWVSLEAQAFDNEGKANVSHFEIIVDNIAPMVYITGPDNNSLLTGMQSVTVTVVEAAGVDRVEFYLNDFLTCTDSIFPYTWDTWNTDDNITGAWNLTARAYSNTGRINETTHIYFIDHDPCWVDITSPTPLLIVSGQFIVTFSAVDNYGVGTCQLFVDGYLNGTLNTPPFQFTWNTALCGEGLHEVNVTVFDLAGNQNSSKISVIVDNLIPMVSVFSPFSGVYFEGTSIFAANASDTSGVDNVTLAIDGTFKGTNTTNLFEFSIDTTTIADGIHIFTFTAHDMVGNANSTSFTVWINNVAPVITSLTLPGSIMAGSDVTATVLISDPFLASVVLHYSVDGGTTWNEVTMSLSTAGSYTGAIPGASLQAGSTLRYYVTATDATGKIGYYQSYNASNPLQIEIGQSLMFYLIIIIIAAAVAVSIVVVLKVRKGRSKGVSKKEVKAAEKAVTPPVKKITKKEVKAAEKAVTPPVKKISKKEGKPPTPATGKVFAEPTQSLMPPLSGSKGEIPTSKKLTVKFKVQGGQMITPSPGHLPVEEKVDVITPAAEQAPVTPAPSEPRPIGVITPNRYVYCATCSQYYEIAEKDLQAGLTCTTCSNPLLVTLTCSSCQGMLSIDIGAFLKGKNMQAPCPNCGKPVKIQ